MQVFVLAYGSACSGFMATVFGTAVLLFKYVERFVLVSWYNQRYIGHDSYKLESFRTTV